MRLKLPITYANVTATLALLVALGGTSYAVASINGQSIKKASIPANRIQPHSIGTPQVSKKLVVAEAKVADTSRQLLVAHSKSTGHHRQAAGSSQGLIPLSVGQDATLLSSGPFTITASCTQNRLRVLASSSQAGWYSSISHDTLEGFSTSPEPANGLVVIADDTTPGALGGQAQATIATPVGDVLYLGPSTLGVGILGSACVVSAYAITN